jgi:hypothetical protein
LVEQKALGQRRALYTPTHALLALHLGKHTCLDAGDHSACAEPVDQGLHHPLPIVAPLNTEAMPAYGVPVNHGSPSARRTMVLCD